MSISSITSSQIKMKCMPDPAISSIAQATSVQFGKIFQPQQQVLLYSPTDWEAFIYEWAHYQKTKYILVEQFAGAGDMGIDVAGFADKKGFDGVWDNFQCKHYVDPLTPVTALPEIAKVLWHSFHKNYTSPRKYYFIAPRDCGMKLKRMLLKPSDLKKHVVDNWDKHCLNAISGTFAAPLTGSFAHYVDGFDFSIFTTRSTLVVIDEHRTTPYHATRFGGGLKARPRPAPAPGVVHADESRYVEQLLEAYGDRLKKSVPDLAALAAHPDHEGHFHRQRESFYHAESLRNFARDTVPQGTFEDLQSEVHAGVIEIEEASHVDALTRMTEVSKAAVSLQLTSNALISTLMIQDRKGICHQLANEDRLRWKKP